MWSLMSRLIAIAYLTAVAGFSGAAPILVVDGDGILTGARNVDVGGVLYDVDFRNGTCVDLFAGCDAKSDFAFQDAASATAASNALLSAVFLDGPSGPFDTDPTRTFGCRFTLSGSPIFDFCVILTPYDADPNDVLGPSFSAAEVVNYTTVPNGSAGANPPEDYTVIVLNRNANFDYTNLLNGVLADWRVVPVPVPSTFVLVGLGLAGLGWSRRRKSRRLVR